MAPLSHTLGGGAAAGETRRDARKERRAKGRRRKGCLGNLTFARFGIKRSYKVSSVKKKKTLWISTPSLPGGRWWPKPITTNHTR